ncbi:hypothetical protein BDR04DRAFT_125528 [Suillus decipiens]|nr:hypothetical protein BDR04DRAFT_125528 [Suillus decipiens]
MRGSSKNLDADFNCSVDSGFVDITRKEPLDASHCCSPSPRLSNHRNAFSLLFAYQSWTSCSRSWTDYPRPPLCRLITPEGLIVRILSHTSVSWTRSSESELPKDNLHNYKRVISFIAAIRHPSRRTIITNML